MKIFLWIVVALILIGMVGAVIFIATFDIDRYRTDIAREISRQTGYPVEMGSLSLRFQKGIVLEVKNFSTQGELKPGGETFSFEANRLFLKLAIERLLKREICVNEARLESPKLSIAKLPAGKETLPQEKLPPPPSPSTASSQGSGSAPLEFKMSEIYLTDGLVVYVDNVAEPPLSIKVYDINLEAFDLSMVTPVRFNGHCDFNLGSRRRIKFEGTFSHSEELLRLTAHLDDSVKLAVGVERMRTAPSVRLDLEITKLDISSFYSEEQKKDHYFAGVLSGNVSASANGKDPAALEETVSGVGKLTLEKGALKNQNMVREAIQKAVPVPGLDVLFQMSLGPQFDGILNGKDTVFEAAEVDFQARGRQISINDFILNHSSYVISMRGTYIIDGPADLKGSLALGASFSAALVKKVKELSFLLNRENEIVIPFTYRGLRGKQVLTPDVGNLVTRTVEKVGTELLTQVLDEAFKKTGLEPEEEENAEQAT